ncbi:MAG: pyruvate kinase [Bacteriovoracaceae bacterium]|nr:pyruvate kinase [Bacteriovoracaceae bacterium]
MPERRAKIIATIGPSSNTVEMISKLIRAGMNAARINMSHGTHETHIQSIANVREASRQVGREVAVLLDLQGPKIRVDKVPTPLQLGAGEEWVIGATEVKDKYPQYESRFIPTVYKDLVKDAFVGAMILFDDGLLEAEAIAKEGDILKIKIKVGGALKSNKGINLPNVKVSAPSYTEKDHEDLMFGLKQGVDYVALSFVRTAQDILDVKARLHKMKVDVPIVSKIETPGAVENIQEILEVTDMIMVARGDMGVEVGNHLVPAIQKKLIKICNEAGKPVITATQMLESMITNPRPTRAEATDVANAIWDGTDCVMLSGETASGSYPEETVLMMNQIVVEAERTPRERPFLRHMDISSVSGATQVAASIVAEKTHARWIVSITESGKSCLQMTKFRPKNSVLGVTNSLKVVRRMALYWGISPFYLQNSPNGDMAELEKKMLDDLKSKGRLVNGDKVVITMGDGKYFQQGSTNSIRVEIIKDVPKSTQTGNQDSVQEVAFARGKLLLDTNVCASCQACVSVCPHGIWKISDDKNRETRIDESRANRCTLDMECVRVCPTGAIEIIPTEG